MAMEEDGSGGGCSRCREDKDNGHDFFQLISDVDDIAFDISVSNESSPDIMRYGGGWYYAMWLCCVN